MSNEAYKVMWRGQESGPFTFEQIAQMVENRQLSGAAQVLTSTGSIMVQDFLQQMEQQQESERLQAQEQAAIQAENERRRMDQLRLEQEQQRIRQKEEALRQHEERESQELTEKASGKKYRLFLDGQKKGPFAAEAVKVMVNSGKADAETLVWTDDLQDWVPLSGYPELLGSSMGSAPPHHGATPPPMYAPPAPYGYSQPTYPQQVPPEAKGSNGIATTALVFALLSLLIFPPIFGLIAFILGIIGICVCPSKGYAATALILSIICPIVGMALGAALAGGF